MNKKKIITIIIGVEAVIIAAIIVFLFYINSDTVKINRQLELAQRYLLEEDYEQAIAAFEVIIDIDPKNVDAYLGLAEAYVEMDDMEKVVKTLKKASKKVDSEEVLEMLEIYTAEMEQRGLGVQEAVATSHQDTTAFENDEVLVSGTTDSNEGIIFQEFTKDARTTFMLEGESTENTDNKIPIYTLDDLNNIENSKGNYILMADIDCAGSAYSIKRFQGTFDGNYHQLQNRSTALFESLDGGTVRNLAIINTSSNTAGLVNCFTEGTIFNCYVTGEIGKNDNNTSTYGGLVQYMFGEKCDISDCYNAADIYSLTDRLGSAGGIIGSVSYNGYATSGVTAFTCCNCENYGTIYGDGHRSIGGICGNIAAEENGPLTSYYISTCINYGTIEINEQEGTYKGTSKIGIGGVVGSIRAGSGHANCTISVSVWGCANYGSLNREGNTDAMAGICGYVDAGAWENAPVIIKIEDCLNVCYSDDAMAGICHSISLRYANMFVNSCIDLSGSDKPVYRYQESYVPQQQGTLQIDNCYFLKYNKDDASTDAIGLNQNEMRNKDSFEGLSGECWGINANINNGYPYIADGEYFEWGGFEFADYEYEN